MQFTKKIMQTQLEDLQDRLQITDFLINSFKISKIYTVADFLDAIRKNRINSVYSLGVAKFNQICDVLQDLGIEIPDTIESKKVVFLIDEIDGIENISLYTKNYIIYKYKLKDTDVYELEKAISKFDLSFKKDDIIDKGIPKYTAYILYYNGIYTFSQLEKLYQKDKLKKINRIGEKRLKEIEELIFS